MTELQECNSAFVSDLGFHRFEVERVVRPGEGDVDVYEEGETRLDLVGRIGHRGRELSEHAAHFPGRLEFRALVEIVEIDQRLGLDE